MSEKGQEVFRAEEYLSKPAVHQIQSNEQTQRDLSGSQCQQDQGFYTRLRTFSLWPESVGHHPTTLVAEGFSYTSIQDYVICCECGLVVGGWRPEDDVTQKHITLSPSCPFMSKKHGSEIQSYRLDREVRACEANTKGTVPCLPRRERFSHEQGNINEENSSLKRRLYCVECKTRFRNTIFLPCGRINYCGTCSYSLKQCPVCKVQIFAKLMCDFNLRK